MNKAVAQNRNTLVIAEDRLILKIDLHSSKQELDSILKIAGISGSNAEKILKGDFSALSADGWNMAGNENSVVQFERSLIDLNYNPQSEPYWITTRIPQIDGKPGYPAKVNYGINKYAKITVYELSSGFTRFIFPGHLLAKRVFLSGSFNNWSTLKGLMKKADGGWVIDIKLEPGAYEYKYIVDGRWTTDPNNFLSVNDGAGNVNSVYYKYNYTFKLSGYASAHEVVVAGDFNDWNANELIMVKKGNTWERRLYLNDGKHTYRLKVDSNWITDPANPLKEKDESGNLNSVINLGETVYFKLTGYASANKVFVAGNFNNWKPGELGMKKTGHAWILPVVLTAGNYDYRFIVDGEWITDPTNAHYTVKKGKTNSFISVKPNHTFKLKGYSDAKTIILTGSFNNWDPNGYTLAHIDDEWTIDFYLKPGKCLYKFRVDGNWILDPGNKLWEPNEFNTGNSVLWME
jgi:1,4-alpha-glucan branching enzyme